VRQQVTLGSKLGEAMRGWRAAGTAFPLDGGSPAIALDVHLEDRGVVNEAVHCGEGHDLVGKYPMPFAKGLV
jgi:hypothetical protein